MIKSVYIENFIRIDQKVTIDLAPVTILVGANGSGKSSILKAIHWAVRCATLKDHNENTSLEQMDYTPSRDFQKLAHKKVIQNKGHIRKIIVGFIDSNDQETEIRISLARNDAGAKAVIEGPLSGILTTEKPETAYIPGIAGLSEIETVLAAPVLRRRAASGEGGSVLRHILLELVGGSASSETDYRELSDLNNLVSRVFPGSMFWVKFDRLRDTRIQALFYTPDMREANKSIAQQRRPLEMAATGYLQVVQIFAYLLLFKPKLLLIDEPDAHLHPSTQERLIMALEKVTTEFPETKFIATTHSSHLVRACSARSRVIWLEAGELREEDEETTRLRMGWGVLDKDIILFTEDKNMAPMRALLSQWPNLERKILLWPTFGKGGISSGLSLSQLRNSLNIRIIVHRDRDFMSDDDLNEWIKKKGFGLHDIPLWVTPVSDMEEIFCRSDIISSVMDIGLQEAEDVIKEAVELCDASEIERDFNNALEAAVRDLPGESRSIASRRWRELGEFCRRTIKGKILADKIDESLKIRFVGTSDARKLSRLSQLRLAVPGIVLAPDLLTEIERVLSGPRPRA